MEPSAFRLRFTEEDLPLNVPVLSYQLAATAPGIPLHPVTGGMNNEIGGGGGIIDVNVTHSGEKENYRHAAQITNYIIHN
jgi:hypothetical protein